MESQVEGFGFWELCSEEGLELEEWGVVDLNKMLLFITDENRNPKSETYNLRVFKSWKRIKPRENN